MEAFSESILHLESIEDSRYVVNTHVASQGSLDGVKKYLKTLKEVTKDKDKRDEAEDLLMAFKGGFKGLD